MAKTVSIFEARRIVDDLYTKKSRYERLLDTLQTDLDLYVKGTMVETSRLEDAPLGEVPTEIETTIEGKGGGPRALSKSSIDGQFELMDKVFTKLERTNAEIAMVEQAIRKAELASKVSLDF